VSGKYTVDGIEMPSVTTVIGMITDKGAAESYRRQDTPTRTKAKRPPGSAAKCTT
jgi:hypothetical protein